ncbi:MAG: C/D box methylation guide ribonucleoprotein complex aNOP56 subunit [Candidatus Bathyarchaeota archaeon]|nr:MAG: C/D box methylation guide ribonucleoprotein complex aNOP56 subunit [Candidatus Bathyarchaeota archaeon]
MEGTALDVENSLTGKVHIVETLIGVFGVAEGNRIIEKTLYSRDPKRISAALERKEAGQVSREVQETIDKLVHRGFGVFVFTNRSLAEALRRQGFDVEVESRSKAGDFIRENLERLAIEYGIAENAAGFYALSHEVSILNSRRAVRRAQSERGAVITQTVQLLNELDKTLNVLSGKLREWYGLHFPELSGHVDSHTVYARIVGTFGDRSNMEAEHLREMGLGNKATSIIASAQNSMGAASDPSDLEQQKRLADLLLSLYNYRPELEEHLTETAREVAPNLSVVAGPILAAKLIEKARSLRKLAMMPSSTVQLLGAEKALFRSKKTRSKPPKHGLIFQHPYIHSKPRELRGRSARALASKLSLAARADAFSGNPIGLELKRQLEEEK